MELRDYIRVLRTRAWFIAVPVALALCGALVWTLLQDPVYEGVAQVLVAQADTGIAVLGIQQPDVAYQPARDNVQTQVEVIQSGRIAGRVVGALGLDATAEDLLRSVAVSADTGTNVIRIKATDLSAEGAAAIANAVADEYVTWSRESERRSISAAATDVESRLAQLEEEIAAAEAQASVSGASGAELVRLEAARERYGNLSDRLEDLRIAEQLATGAGSVLATATANPTPASPDLRRNLALALALGLLTGLFVVLIAEQVDTRMKSPEEATTVYDAPVLASIPTDGAGKRDGLRLLLTDRSGGAAAEAYRVLRNNLSFVNIDKDIKTVLVTSASPGEGKSTAAANLATVLAQAGAKVALVACDFYQPTIDRFLELESPVGLSDVLQGRAYLWSAAQRFPESGELWILGSGTMPPNPSALLGSEAMGSLIADMREAVDWIILDSTPVLSVADATAVSRWADGVLVVVRVGVSRREAARACREHLQNVGARVLGLIAWVPTVKVAHGYDVHYGYGYGEGYGRDS